MQHLCQCRFAFSGGLKEIDNDSNIPTLEMAFISIVIPALNEQEVIARTIAAIPRELVSEIIVVDNGSTDRTAKKRGGQGRASSASLCEVMAALVVAGSIASKRLRT